MKVNELEPLDTFEQRMKRLGIEVEVICNWPWIYLYKINGEIVKEKFQGNHGFTLAFLPVRRDKPFHFTDITEIFKIIRKYCKK